MDLWSPTRREVVYGLAGGLSIGGCLNDDVDPYENVTADLRADVEIPLRPVEIELAHWFPKGTFDSLRRHLETHPKLSIREQTAANRKIHETAIAEAVVQARPPELIQTVLGEELRRYATSAVVDRIPDVVDETIVSQIRPEFRSLFAVDDAHFAVPLSITPLNVLFVDVTRLRTQGYEPEDLTDLDTFLEMTDDMTWGLTRSGSHLFQLFAQVLLAVEDVSGYVGAQRGDIWMEVLRRVADLVSAFVTRAHWIPFSPHPDQMESFDLLLYNPSFSDVLASTRWTPIPFPGTDGVSVFSATGVSLAKRGNNPNAAISVLKALTNPQLQRAIARRCHRLPVVADGSLIPSNIAPLAELYWDGQQFLPSLSTGIGLDSDVRWQAVQFLASANWNDPDSIAEELGRILR